MDKNTIIGISLIFLLFYLWAKMNAPTEEQLAEMQRVQDSIEQAQELPPPPPQVDLESPEAPVVNEDSLKEALTSQEFGPFAAAAASGVAETRSLENDLIKVDFSTQGGHIESVQLKQYTKSAEGPDRKPLYLDLLLLNDEKNRFEYLLPVPTARGGIVRTSDLHFAPTLEGNTLTMSADIGGGRTLSQIYTLGEGYDVQYRLQSEGLDQILDPNRPALQLRWINYLDKLEINTQYERIYSSVYFKEANEDPDHCSCTSDDEEDLSGAPVKWISHANQFFNTSLIAATRFDSVYLETRMLDEKGDDLKLLTTQLSIPYASSKGNGFDMTWYLGPNEFDILQAYELDLEDIIPFGASIFGTINRWVIRPIFSFLSSYVGSAGIVILLLTLIVKSLVYPLTYKMLYSQSKMGALKPQMAKLREKYKDDQQKVQMETMKIYREYGVNPAGGCFPMILQMPIWFALYRFFPASIEFRQTPFLWATDLSSYDVFFRLPFEIPFLGAHLSLFTFLWAVSMLVYTYYNSKIMDMSSINPMMKYMQYLMPLMFVFFFNSYASGLTCYLLFSNLLNITQTLVTKNYLINNDKILAELDANKAKPKKKGGFQARLEQALKEQQRMAAEQQQQKSKKRR